MLTVKNYQKENFPVLKFAMDKANLMLKKQKALTTEMEEELNKAFESCGVFNPKKSARLNFLYKKATKTEEEMKEFEDLSVEEKLYQESFYAKDLETLIKEDYGKPCDLSYKALYKINGKTEKEYGKYSLPFVFFKDFKTDKGYPTSIANILVTKDELEVSKDFYYRVNILSVVYDQIKKEYVRHLWRMILEPVEQTIKGNADLLDYEDEEAMLMD